MPDFVSELNSASSKEPIASFLKLELLELSAGYAKVAMPVLPEHVNFNGFVFGGIVASVADQALAYASNSLHRPSVGCHLSVEWVSAAAVGDRLVAEGRVVRSGKRVGLAEITVTNQTGKLIAKATGITIPMPRPASPAER